MKKRDLVASRGDEDLVSLLSGFALRVAVVALVGSLCVEDLRRYACIFPGLSGETKK